MINVNFNWRSSMKYTTGISITNQTNDGRFLFFEMDKPMNWEHFNRVNDVFRFFELDWICHRTGDGWHWISPTLLRKEAWKLAHELLNDVNRRCPMTTLRIVPNKYPHEDEIWYSHNAGYFNNQPELSNSLQLCNLLNFWFKEHFQGSVYTELKKPRYVLP